LNNSLQITDILNKFCNSDYPKNEHTNQV